MTSTDPAIAGLFDALLGLTRRPVLVPRRKRVGHTIAVPRLDGAPGPRPPHSIETMLAGKGARSFSRTSCPSARRWPPPSELETLEPGDLLARWHDVTAIRRDELAAMTDDDLAHPSVTPVGPGTYGRFMAIRVFDFWVHEQDIRRPLARPGHEHGPAAEMAIDEIAGSLGYIVGKRIGLGRRAEHHLRPDGPGRASTCTSLVDGRAGVVDELDDPTVTLTTDSTTFALLACGRIDPQGPIDEGRHHLVGAMPTSATEPPGRLRFTM